MAEVGTRTMPLNNELDVAGCRNNRYDSFRNLTFFVVTNIYIFIVTQWHMVAYKRLIASGHTFTADIEEER